ncbi:hypothetical protein CoNPh35_CDS0026 [Staphylococcus phage S-CoN_Ph35]|nr:hypothetical protein CoNPh35_CDS0026 [Staphylococcus phage S-CoN_Ph35]
MSSIFFDLFLLFFFVYLFRLTFFVLVSIHRY